MCGLWAQTGFISTDGSGGAYVSDSKHIVRYSSEGGIIWERDISDIGIPQMTGVRGWGAHPRTDADNNYICALSVAKDWVPAPWNPDILIPGMYEVHVVKYDSETGDELWVKSYASPADDEPPEGNGLFVDVSGNVYIATPLDNEFYIEKSDPNGNMLWNAVYNRPDSMVDTVKAMTLDEYGNVYVCGTEKRVDPDAPPGWSPQPDVAVTIK